LQNFQSGVDGFVARHGSDPGTAAHQSLGMIYDSLQQQSSLLSFIDVFHLMGWLFLAAAPLVLFMQKATHRKGPATAAE
jgi:hypothetical protein